MCHYILLINGVLAVEEEKSGKWYFGCYSCSENILQMSVGNSRDFLPTTSRADCCAENLMVVSQL